MQTQADKKITVNPRARKESYRLRAIKISETRKRHGKYEISAETRHKIGLAALGRIPWNKGKKGLVTMSARTRKRMSKAHSGKRSSFWKGGVTKHHAFLRSSLRYRLWREAILKRDNFTCNVCGQVGGKLNVDHIQPFAYYPLLRFELSNGRTLCHECHKATDTFLGKARKHKV